MFIVVERLDRDVTTNQKGKNQLEFQLSGILLLLTASPSSALLETEKF